MSSTVERKVRWTTKESIDELYGENIEAATRLAYLLLGDEQAAQDVAHDAFIKAASRLPFIRDLSAFPRYFNRAVVNACLSRFRRKRIERLVLERQRSLVRESTNGRDVAVEQSVRATVANLPPRQRAAIVLHFFLDLSESETANALDCSVAAAKSLIARGLRGLRSQIQREDWQSGVY